MRRFILAFVLGIFVEACGDGGSVAPGPVASQLAFTVQPGASTAGQAISPAVQVSIEDVSGIVVTNADVPISIGLTNSGATLSGATTLPASGGVASFAELQINKPGTGYTLTASATGLANAISAVFDVSPAPGIAATIAPLAAQTQTGTVGLPVGTSPSVLVSDGLGSPIEGVNVEFAVIAGGGSVSERSRSTGPDGVATIGQWTLGNHAGSNVLLATASGLEDSPVSFTAEGNHAEAAELKLHAGDEQTTRIGTRVDEAPAVLVTDRFGNPVDGVTVTFNVAPGNGSLSGTEQVTSGDGIAAVGSWTLGNSPGRNALVATSANLVGSPVTFHANAVTGATVEVRNDYFRSLRNGSGAPGDGEANLFGHAAVDTIGPGEAVTWVWAGQNHNVTATSFEASATQNTPHTFSVTFESRGTYIYWCTTHSRVLDPIGLVGMRGQIVVR